MKNFILAVTAFLVSMPVAMASDAPYAGQQTREIKSLSGGEIDGYLTGKGMGYAKPAELNHYPGPRHVLDLSRELELSDAQVSGSQAIFDSMKAQAVALGRELVEKEMLLEHHFADGTIDADRLRKLTLEIGNLDARIRFVHLEAHIMQKKLLNARQLQIYDRHRGYDDGKHGAHEHTH